MSVTGAVTGALILLIGAGMAEAGKTEKATFAAGCFWCTQPPYDKVPGVLKTTVGYTGGSEPRPTYQEVSSGRTGHAEALEILYDPARVSYEQLLDIFWRNINPTTQDQQFPDYGRQYRTAIFYHTDAQKKAALDSKERLEKSGRFDAPIVTEIQPASAFWPAEDYHQKYYQKSPDAYKRYSENSGRKQYFEKTWEKNKEP